MKIKIQQTCILQYVLIYLCFLNTSSKAAKMYGDIFIIVTMVVAIASILLRVVKLTKKYAFYMIILFGAVVLQHTLIQHNISFSSVMNLLSKFLISYCAIGVCSSKFFSRFVKTTVFLSVISLIFFLISQSPLSGILTQLLIPNYAPCWTGNISYGRFLYHYMPGYTRNVGLYTEPGVFQLFLNLALFCVLFWAERCNVEGKKRIKYAAILIVTIISAMSTAGYLTMFIILSGFVLAMKNKLSTKNILLLLVFFLVGAIFTQTELFVNTFIDKMQFSIQSGFSQGTGNARFASVLIDLEYIKNNIWGYGYSGSWTNTSTIAKFETGSSVGLTSMINVYGVPIASFIYITYLCAFKRISYSRLEFIILILMFISSFLSQPWILTPVYLTMMMYGLFFGNSGEDKYLAWRGIE